MDNKRFSHFYQESMKARTILGLAMGLTAALAVAAAHRRADLPPADLRDAVAEPSALDQLDVSGAGLPSVPEPAGGAAPSRAENYNAGSLASAAFGADDIMALLASTGEGGDLLGHFQRGETDLPELVHYNRLKGADKETARGAGLSREEDRVAFLIKDENFKNNRPHIVLYKSDWPLFATTCIVAHELQHAVDHGAPWYGSITRKREEAKAKLAKANARGYLLLEDMALEDLGHGLGHVRTFFTEYLAYSRGSAVLKELLRTGPGTESLLADFREAGGGGRAIIERDPLNDPQDRREFMDTYFLSGNQRRFKAGAEAVLKDKKLVAELRAAGLDTALSELAALRDRE